MSGVECPWCHGRLALEADWKVHSDTCPARPRKPVRTINDMMAALGSRFRVEEPS